MVRLVCCVQWPIDAAGRGACSGMSGKSVHCTAGLCCWSILFADDKGTIWE